MSDFDQERAKKFLQEREEKEKNRLEQSRKETLDRTISILKEEFKESSIEVYLVGSILQPFQFKDFSDIDIVLKNFSGDYFEIWSKLSLKFDRTIEVILFETCHFQDHILKTGLKVI